MHNSNDHIAFLKVFDDKYPKGDKIQLILNKLRGHSTQKVIEHPEICSDRYEFVFTLKHASRLNLVEGFINEMTKQVLHENRVTSKEELKERIYKYFDEINAAPVVYHWVWNLQDINPNEESDLFAKVL